MKNARFIVNVVFVASMFVPSLPAWAGITDDVAPSVVFLTQDVPAGKDASNGSGFLIRKGDKPFLITASHVARDIGTSFKIIMPGHEGQAVTNRLKGVKWNISPTADVAMLLIKTSNQDEYKALLNRCLPANLITARPLPPSRDFPLIVMGYPLCLGTTGFVSPLSLETHAASGFITMERFDNKKLATFILLQSPSTSGLSGGPVFDIGKSYFEGRDLTARNGVSLVGLISGVIYDKTGGKFSMVVPSTEIARLLESSAGSDQSRLGANSL
jgi:hypothetical protein